MSLRTSISYSALSIALITTPAFADITGPQVWDDWQAYMRGFGYEMSGNEQQSGGTLTVSDISMNVEFPDGEGSFVVNMGTLGFVDQGDGTVRVNLPETMPMMFEISPPDGESAKGTLTYTQASPEMVVSGDPNDMTYVYSAASINMTVQDLVVDGQALPTEMMNILFTMTDVANTTRMKVGDLRDYMQNMSVGSLTYDVSFVVPEPEPGRGSLQGAMNGLTFNGAGTLPIETDVNDVEAMLSDGFAIDGGFAYTSGNSDVDMVTPDGPLKATTSSDGGTVRVKMGADGLDYDVSQANLSVNMQQMPDVPFPISMQLAEAAFNLKMPLQAAEEEQDFALGFTMGNFTISDAIWNIFDPAGQLPRDPATLDLDLTGKARVLLNILDPEQAAAMESGTAPGELNAIDINALLVRLAGAELSGAGAFTFDNADLSTFPGFPKPTGALDVRVEGANGLIDTLVQMGLLPEEQAMGARMMMGLFGVPQGDDVLTSKIEVNDQGHVLANGQRLQ